MSGGVDSSVAACLLQEQGYEVVGSHMNLVHLDGVEHGCCGPAARADAAEVARIAGFPFEIVDLSDEFDGAVIGDFVSEHEAGRTPNPCARCNGEIKFGAFLRRADELGVDFVATGHYVRTLRDDAGRGTCAAAPTRRRIRATCSTCSGSAARALALPDRRHAQVRDARPRGTVRAAGRVEARLAGAVFRARGDAGGFVRSIAPHLGAPARSWTPRPASRHARRRVALHDRPAAGPGRRARRAGVRARRRRRGEPRRDRAAGAARSPGVDGRPGLVGRGGAAVGRVFEAEVQIRYRGEASPPWWTRARRAGPAWSSVAAAGGRARPERRDLPRRGLGGGDRRRSLLRRWQSAIVRVDAVLIS